MPSPYPTVYYFIYSSFRSCVTDAKNLAAEVDKNILPKTYADKVNIVSHSMGGLIARHSIANNGLPVDKLVMIGPPNAGSTVAFLGWANSSEPLPTLYKFPLQQLMPAYKYDWMYDSVTGEPETKLQKKFLNQFLVGLNNKPLSASTEYYSIFNSALDTPKDVSVLHLIHIMNDYSVGSYGGGDGTVLADSAALAGAANYDIRDSSNMGRHEVLPANNSVLSIVDWGRM